MADSEDSSGTLGYWSVVSIGIGGMVGGGIFAVLGLAVALSRGGAPVAFAIAGAVALITSYSYVRMSVTYPSEGGTVEFINQAFGTGVITGGLNVLLWMSYVIMLSLYAYAFGSYGASFAPESMRPWIKHVAISGVIVVLTGLNVLGSKLVGKAEEWIVAAKLAILLLFIGVGFWSIDTGALAPSAWTGAAELVAGGMIVFLAYEGFELIANTARDVRNAARTLPRAYYSAVGFVIVLYVLVAAVTVGNLAVDRIVSAEDYALAEAARPFLGRAGFAMIAVAALLSTGSAINATLYGAARVSYIIAKEGEMPEELEKKVWHKPVEGLLITAGLTLLAANLFNLSSISTIGSAGFLLIFTAVNAANLRLRRHTRSNAWLPVTGVGVCLAALGTLIWQRATVAPNDLWILAAMLAAALLIEGIYRGITGRSIRPFHLRRGVRPG